MFTKTEEVRWFHFFNQFQYHSKLFIILVLTLPNIVIGQDYQDQNIREEISILPPSPDAAGLGKYVDFPQVANTGVPSIEIPLYSAKEGKLTLPIFLSYHASGVKIGQNSSCAGLGWNLVAGGVITRVVKGVADDYYSRHYLDVPYHESTNSNNIGWLFDHSGRVRVNNPDFPGIKNDHFDYQWNTCSIEEKDQSRDICRKFDGEFIGYDYPKDCPDIEKCVYEDPRISGGCGDYFYHTTDFSFGPFEASPNHYDTEPDIFYINVAGLNVKFIFDRNGEAQLLNSTEKIKIKPLFLELPKFPDDTEICPECWYDLCDDTYLRYRYLVGFIITDANGTKYTFDKMEMTTTTTYRDVYKVDLGSCELTKVTGEDGFRFVNYSEEDAVSTAWYLTKIENQYGDQIELGYVHVTDVEYTQSLGEYENLYYENIQTPLNYFFCVENRTNTISVKLDKYYLSNIKGTNFRVDFNMFSSNKEMTNARYIDNIEIYSTYGGTDIRRKKFDFTINSVASSNEYYLEGKTQPLYRNYLDKIQEYGQTDGDIKPAYTFTYFNREALPNKYSREQDFWGYYNNNGNDDLANGGSLLPEIYIYPEQTGANRYSCYPLEGMGTEVVLNGKGDRTVNSNTCYFGTLRQLHYPTGGYTEYTYEPNSFYDEQALEKNQLGAGIRIQSIKKYNEDGGLSLQKNFRYIQEANNNFSSGVLTRKPVFAKPKTYYSNTPTGIIGQTVCGGEQGFEYWKMNSELDDFPIPVNSDQYCPGYGRNYLQQEVEDFWTKYTERSSSSYSSLEELEGLIVSYTNVIEDNVGNGETHYSFFSPKSYSNPYVCPFVKSTSYNCFWPHYSGNEQNPFEETLQPIPFEYQIWGSIEQKGRNIFPYPAFTDTEHNLFTKPIKVKRFKENGDLVETKQTSYSTIKKHDFSKVYGLVYQKHNMFNTYVLLYEICSVEPFFSQTFKEVPYAYARYYHTVGSATLKNTAIDASGFSLVASTDFDGNSFGNLDYNSSKVVSLLGSNALQLGSSSEVIVNGLSKGSYMVSFTADIKPGETVIVNNSVIPENSFYGENTYREANIFIDLESTNSIRIFTTDEEEIIDNIKIYKCIYSKTDYKYNSELKLSEKTTYNSNDKDFKTYYQYPYDFCGDVFKEMVDKNIVDEPVLLKETHNDNLLSFSFTNYKVLQNNAIVPSINYTFDGTPPVSFPLWQSNQANLYYEEILLIGDYGNQGLNIYSINNTARGSKLELNLEHIDQGDMVTIYLYNVTQDKAEMIYMNHPDYSKSVEVKLEDYCEYNVKIHSIGSINVTGYINVSYPSCYFMSNTPYIRRNVNFDSYNQEGNLLQYHKEHDINVSYLWGYNNTYPIAKVSNAKANEIYFTSYEDEPYIYTPNGEGTYSFTTFKKSGALSLITVNNNSTECFYRTEQIYPVITSSTKFTFSVWVYSSNPSAQIYLFWDDEAGENWDRIGYNYATTTIKNQWVLLEGEATVPAGTRKLYMRVDNNGSGTVWFDDLRLHPSEASMTTYTYDPLVGMTSSTDERNRTTHYIYDDFGRLKEVKDHENKVLESYKYHYAE